MRCQWALIPRYQHSTFVARPGIVLIQHHPSLTRPGRRKSKKRTWGVRNSPQLHPTVTISLHDIIGADLALTPTQQCVEYDTFIPPPLDGSCTFPEAIDWHLAHSPNHILYTYPSAGSLATISWREETAAIYRAAHIARSYAQNSTARPRFAILAVSDTITFSTVLCGLVRAGFAPFLPSPRVSAQVLGQLLDAAGSTHVFYSPDAATTSLVRHGVAHRDDVTLIPMPAFEDLFPNDTKQTVEAPPVFKPNPSDLACIIHSSGSTNVPKLMPISHFTYMLCGIAPWHNSVDIGSLTVNYSAAVLFHLMGLMHLFFGVYCGARIAVFKPAQPPVQLHLQSFMENTVATRSSMLMSMPSLLESASSEPEYIKWLQRLKLVVYGGATLKKSSGDRLVQGGVKLCTLWGMSEMGIGTELFAEPLGTDWQWMRFASHINAQFNDLGDGSFELIIVSHEGHHIDRPNVEINGKRAIATNDIILRHPTDPTLFKIVGRLDDQIVLSTAEKTNAIPLEGILRSDPKIDHAVFFGRSRPHNGVIVMPYPEYAFEPSDTQQLAQFREEIWPTVVKMNNFAPSHSRLVKEMVLVASPSKPFAINPTKHTVVRAQVTAAYDDEINKAYEDFKSSSVSNFPPPSSWEIAYALPFVRSVVQNTLPDVKGDDDDVFNLGCDSLLAARIHNTIVKALRASGVTKDKIVADSVYKFPTVKQLANYTSAMGLAVNMASKSVTAETDKTAEILHMLDKYTQSFPLHKSEGSAPRFSGLVFLVTGTTGGLGTNLLAQLLSAPNVSIVYALNRTGGSDISLLDRHKAAFNDRGVDTTLLDSPKFMLLQGNTSRQDLGIDSSIYDEMLDSLTHIIHNAWPVNFNYSIATFESAVKGSKHLVDLALKSRLSSPPRFMFISSISVSRNAGFTEALPTEDEILDPTIVVGQGYPESKWIVERMLHIASEKTSLQSVSVRVGQLAGGASGCWNVSDWVPVIVRSAAVLGCLPDCESDIYWIRLEEAASSLIEMRDATGILHLVHPQPIPWNAVFKVFSASSAATIVPFSEWMAGVEEYGLQNPEGGRYVPALRLLEFYKSLGKEGFAAMSRTENVSITKAVRVSPVLRNMSALDETDVKKWLAYWRRSGVID